MDDTKKDSVDDDLNDTTLKLLNLLGVQLSANSVDHENILRMSNEYISCTATPIPPLTASLNHAKIIDKIWSRQIYEMSMEEREDFMNELHGVKSRAFPETKSSTQAGLEAMEQEISSFVCQASTNSLKDAEDLVKGHLVAIDKLKSKYVVATEFRIRFLRAELFDAKKAAVRYFRNLNLLLEVFGEISLQRPLQKKDLSEDEQNCLASGTAQILRNRDKMGRRVLLLYIGHAPRYDAFVRQRVHLYLILGLMGEDVETQIHGAVHVNVCDLGDSFNRRITNNSLTNWHSEEVMAYKMHWSNRDNIFGPKAYVRRSQATSIRWSSFHICMPPARIYHLYKSLLLWLMPMDFRARTRVHIGTFMEYRYDLAQLGIPISELQNSYTKASAFKLKSLEKFLRGREAVDSFRRNFAAKHGIDYYRCKNDSQRSERTNEEVNVNKELPIPTTFITEDICPGTECPESNCVIFGDRSNYKHPANVEFREYLWNKEKSLFSSGDESQLAVDNLMGTKKNKNLLRLKVDILDEIIDEACVPPLSGVANDEVIFKFSSSACVRHRGFKFASYDKVAGWYRYIDPMKNEKDRIELRKKISQSIRDERKRSLRSHRLNEKGAEFQNEAEQEAASSIFSNNASYFQPALQGNGVAQQPLSTPSPGFCSNAHYPESSPPFLTLQGNGDVIPTARFYNNTECCTFSSTTVHDGFDAKRLKLHNCFHCHDLGSFHKCFCGL